MCHSNMKSCAVTLRVFIILICFRESLSTLKVYRIQKTKNDAEQFCESIGGVLLAYGSSLVNSAKYCSLTSVLTNKPSLKYLECYYVKTPFVIAQKFSANHLANCAEFCSDASIKFIGVQADNCLCYDSLSGASPTGICDSVACPGNNLEQCGRNNMVGYRKDDYECQYVQFGNSFQLLSENCDTARNFICKVNDGSLATECLDYIGNNTKPSNQALVNDSGANLGLILGLTLGILAIIVLVLAFVFFRLRKSKKQKEDRLRIQPRTGVANGSRNDDIINAFRESSGYHNADMRNKDPLPLVAFDSEGVDLDRDLIPAYTAVHKKPQESISTGNMSHKKNSHEPAYDEVYQPSNVRNHETNGGPMGDSYDTNGGLNYKGPNNGPYNRTGSMGELRNSDQNSRGNRRQSGSNEHVQNELSNNKLFRNSQHKNGTNDDDMY